MATQALTPANTEERLVWVALTATYPLYFIGALYISGPVLAWLLFALVLKRSRQPQGLAPIPLATWLWICGMLLMLLALIVGHLDWQLGLPKLIKSSIGWAKGWALLALFVLAGSLSIRPQIVYRAAMVVCLHTLCLLPLFIFAWLLGLPGTPYVSPLKVIGGPGPEFFAVSLYEIDPGSGLPRWRLFTPWAPALGFVANIFFLFAMQEKERQWRWIGICASIAMILMSQSRLAAVSLIVLAGLPLAFSILRGPRLFILASAASTVFALIGITLLQMASDFWESFKGARADSTRVRATLARIAIQRWRDEAPIWGHGIVERGPHLVEYMPIGSHHSWYGLLFVKGIVGFAALAIPLLGSLLLLGLNARHDPLIRTGFSACALLMLYTFGENLEILAYLIWPALLLIGIAHGRSVPIAQQPTSAPLTPLQSPKAS
ncbi:O-antigen ligase domain-containing protein [Amphritea sp. 1_MG-2023]|uniref:O-antigen ligase family protein n=1 Tax=Amphritea sp. 1_MG-2023 TaxID=3062670 RepID=UPI0026E242F4|nr:O-antigen ligase family protein [Amphritea sp. 1_MG-2023]MDO6563775.1 O-antigen ligase domain-containing protein [Amphritea sp. 1_MG-2023]